jgi:cell shape-determining protein MreD
MGVLALFAWGVLASAFPDAAPTWLSIDRHAPDLWAALAVWLGTRANGHGAVAWAALLGGLKDACSLDPLGTHAFTLAVVTFAFVRKRGVPPRGASLAMAVFSGTLLAHAVYVLRSVPLHRGGPVLANLVAGFPTALWTALFAWPLLTLVDRAGLMNDLVGRRRGGLPA